MKRPRPAQSCRPTDPRRARALAWAALCALATGCAGDPLDSSDDSTAETIEEQAEIARSAGAARVELRYPRFFTLTEPDPDTSCAGDLKTYLQAFERETEATTGREDAAAFPTSAVDSARSIKPNFLKNVSVDLTDASSPQDSNEARFCSVRDASSGSPPPSACAAFDYGALGGVRASLNGSVLLFGGVQGRNLAGPASGTTRGVALSCGVNEGGASPSSTACRDEVLAVSVSPDGATTELKSAWAELAPSTSGGTRPSAGAGRSAVFSQELQKIYFHGGSQGNGATTQAWVYDLATQAWSTLRPGAGASTAMQRLIDVNLEGESYNLPRAAGPHTLSAMVAVPRLGMSGLTSGATALTSVIDTTDRIVVAGGMTSNGGSVGVSYGTYRFNPTFGPEYADRRTTPAGYPAPATHAPLQWIESFHTQPMSNGLDVGEAADWDATLGNVGSVRSSLFAPRFDAAVTAGSPVFAMGGAPLTFSDGTVLAGSLALAGGFNAAVTAAGPTADVAPPATRALYFASRLRPTGLAPSRGELNLSQNFSFLANEKDGEWLSPVQWIGTSDLLLRYGAGQLLPGFNLAQNDLVFFGGTNCQDFLTNAGRAGCNFTNPGRYFRLGDSPTEAGTHDLTPATWGTTADADDPPNSAGLAAARGLDENGNVVILALGGMSQNAQNVGPAPLWILYDNGGAYTWMRATPENGSSDPGRLVHAAMVYSHVTHKFYLFGGYRSTSIPPRTVAETWELSVTGAPGASYRVRLRNLTPEVTCEPTCPGARRGHRFVEVNYDNRTPRAEPVCTDRTQPCSFGLFMEGGSPDGVSVLGDRWMFDPTARNGKGHWQRVDGFPPRTLAAMATVEYTVPNTQQRVRRAVMFGGETALQNPGAARPAPGTSETYLVPPTLGDTQLYDFENDRWERAELYGKGYATATMADPANFADETSWREAFDADAPVPTELAALTPPPLSGAMMVTRTLSGPARGAASPPRRLAIPEVYLFGGRRKDGTLASLEQTWKFCLGSTGEWYGSPATVADRPTDCDAFDPDTNPSSPSPVAAPRGRWLSKTPDDALTAGSRTGLAELHSFQGAAAYDSLRDRIVFVGGVDTELAAGQAPALGTTLQTSAHVYEYTPPSKQDVADRLELHGRWTDVPVCDFSSAGADHRPAPRYGHSLVFDTLNDQLLMVGGFRADPADPTHLGEALVDSYGFPEVWSGKRIESTAEFPSDFGALITPPGAPCYFWRRVKVPSASSSPVFSEGGLAHAAAVAIAPAGYDTGYYSTFDQFCAKAGPVSSNDAEVSKLLAGGLYIDLDRSQLGPNENVLLHLKYLPLGPANQRPEGGPFGVNESAVFRVHLVQTGQSESALRRVLQPRHLTYYDAQAFPRVVHTLTHLAPSGSGVREDQIVLPVSMSPGIDRVRIERYSGSAILIEATVHRMGYR